MYFTGLTVRDLTAKRGTDFSLQSSNALFASFELTSSVTVAGTADLTDEGVEVFELSIATDVAYTVGTPSKATVYIQDVTGACTYTKQSDAF